MQGYIGRWGIWRKYLEETCRTSKSSSDIQIDFLLHSCRWPLDLIDHVHLTLTNWRKRQSNSWTQSWCFLSRFHSRRIPVDSTMSTLEGVSVLRTLRTISMRSKFPLSPCSWLMSKLRYLVKLKNGVVEVTSNDYPLFLYDNEEFHEEDPYLGLCRGPFLVKVGHLTLPLHFYHLIIPSLPRLLPLLLSR